jgi:hypothetical protein
MLHRLLLNIPTAMDALRLKHPYLNAFEVVPNAGGGDCGYLAIAPAIANVYRSAFIGDAAPAVRLRTLEGRFVEELPSEREVSALATLFANEVPTSAASNYLGKSRQQLASLISTPGIAHWCTAIDFNIMLILFPRVRYVVFTSAMANVTGDEPAIVCNANRELWSNLDLNFDTARPAFSIGNATDDSIRYVLLLLDTSTQHYERLQLKTSVQTSFTAAELRHIDPRLWDDVKKAQLRSSRFVARHRARYYSSGQRGASTKV